MSSHFALKLTHSIAIVLHAAFGETNAMIGTEGALA